MAPGGRPVDAAAQICYHGRVCQNCDGPGLDLDKGWMVRIALLEDETYQAQLMQVWIEAAGHDCRVFNAGKPFIEALQRDSYDLLVLDWLLPDINGDEVLKWVREHLGWQIPVIFVTQKDSEADVVRGLELGADDYMAKPVKPLEMLARITALGRRSQTLVDDSVLACGDFSVDVSAHTVMRDGVAIELTHKEFELALFLFRNIGRLLSRSHILESVWGQSAQLNTRTVDTHISRIRNKLDLSPENGWRLSGIYHHGYRLERHDPAESQVS